MDQTTLSPGGLSSRVFLDLFSMVPQDSKRVKWMLPGLSRFMPISESFTSTPSYWSQCRVFPDRRVGNKSNIYGNNLTVIFRNDVPHH